LHRRKRDRLRWLALALSIGVPAASAQIAFTDVSTQAGVGRAGESYGASWGDLNGDAYLDIFASNHRTQPSLFLNKGDGTFLETAKQVKLWVNRPKADTHGGTWADFDNDGDQDLMITTGTGNLSQFLVNDRGRLVDQVTQYGLGIKNVGGRLPVWLDFNGDDLLDVALTQYGGIAKLFQQNAGGGGFTEVTTPSNLRCKRFHYGHLYDVTNDGRLDFLCPEETLFPQKIYNTLPFPWQKLFDNTIPNTLFPIVEQVVDSIIGDFNNDGRMDMFLLSGVQLHPSSVVQGGPTSFEAQLAGGTKGFTFITAGAVTIAADWNKADEGTTWELAKIDIGASGQHPTAIPFTLDPSDPGVAGMPPPPAVDADIPAMQIGFDPATQRWTLFIQTKLTPSSPNTFSEAYLQVNTTAPVSNLESTGLWAGDKEGPPTLLMNFSGGFSDETVAAGLDTPVQCASVTAGDFDNDTYLDLFLACRTGASNEPDIVYRNQGNGTFVAVPNAGGAEGPVGVAVASGAGTADSAITGDFDADGFLDLFVTNGINLRPLLFGGPNKLFRNQGKDPGGNTNHWIELDLVGTQSDRDAVGARVYATANGVTQFRVQNGAYHRWSQDAVRSHFGLAGASTVDLKVEWPSGAIDTFFGVASDVLYRITENGGIAPVALGDAPAYACGPPVPALNAAVDAGVFIWRDCPSGKWILKTVSGGAKRTYVGHLDSSAAFTTVTPVSLSSNDVLDFTTDPQVIDFSFVTNGTDTDGINFVTHAGASTCVSINAPAGVQVFVGPLRVPVAQPFDLDTQSACGQ
jgi:hypothetical protein